MTKYIFIGDTQYGAKDIGSRAFYYAYNNLTSIFETSSEIHISLVMSIAEAAKLIILEGDTVELFCISSDRSNRITKSMFTIITTIIDKVNKANIVDCNTHIIT